MLWAACVGIVGCAGPEPDFRVAALSESEVLHYDPESEVMDFDEIRAAGLGATISEDPPPPAFDPSEIDYPAVSPDANLLVALHAGVPRLVDVLAIEPADHDELLSAVDVDSGERLTVVLPHGYVCSTASTVSPGSRYLLITSHQDARGFHVLHVGVGAEHSIMHVDERGLAYTRTGLRDAHALVAESRRAS